MSNKTIYYLEVHDSEDPPNNRLHKKTCKKVTNKEEKDFTNHAQQAAPSCSGLHPSGR